MFSAASRHRNKGNVVSCLRDRPGLGGLETWIPSLVLPCLVALGMLTQFPLRHPKISWGLASATIMRREVWDLCGEYCSPE